MEFITLGCWNIWLQRNGVSFRNVNHGLEANSEGGSPSTQAHNQGQSCCLFPGLDNFDILLFYLCFLDLVLDKLLFFFPVDRLFFLCFFSPCHCNVLLLLIRVTVERLFYGSWLKKTKYLHHNHKFSGSLIYYILHLLYTKKCSQKS